MGAEVERSQPAFDSNREVVAIIVPAKEGALGHVGRETEFDVERIDAGSKTDLRTALVARYLGDHQHLFVCEGIGLRALGAHPVGHAETPALARPLLRDAVWVGQ